MKNSIELNKDNIGLSPAKYALNRVGINTPLSDAEVEQVCRISIKDIETQMDFENSPLMAFVIYLDDQPVMKYIDLDYGEGEDVSILPGAEKHIREFIKNPVLESKFKLDYHGKPASDIDDEDYFLNVVDVTRYAAYYLLFVEE